MTINESNIFRGVGNLIEKCPPPSANPYALGGYIDACMDYKTINRYVNGFLDKLLVQSEKDLEGT